MKCGAAALTSSAAKCLKAGVDPIHPVAAEPADGGGQIQAQAEGQASPSRGEAQCRVQFVD